MRGLPTLSTLRQWRAHSSGKPVGRAQRCAVVGSSASLLDEAWGDAIDANDWVIRVNYAPAGVGVNALWPATAIATAITISITIFISNLNANPAFNATQQRWGRVRSASGMPVGLKRSCIVRLLTDRGFR